MAEISPPSVVTAIANPELEGFIAGTLYSQGWNVVFRALDLASLTSFIEADAKRSANVLLLYSPDLPGLSPQAVSSFQGQVRQLVGFAKEGHLGSDYPGVLGVPEEPFELLNIVRGFVRTPLVRNVVGDTPATRRANVVAVGSIAGASGCTTLAINLAMELSALGRETVLVDADVHHPSIAPLLSLHKLDSDTSTRVIAPHLSVSEFTREHVPRLGKYLDEIFEACDFAVIDLGSISGVSDSMTDRRWTSSLVHWSCERADELWVVGKADTIGIHRLEKLVRDFSQITMRAKISVVLNMSTRGRKGKLREDQYFAAAAPLRPLKQIRMPRDTRATTKAEEERATLLEIDDRSSLRKSIAMLALGLTS